MTYRELSKQVMLSKGLTLEEIEARQKISSSAIPGAAAFVDLEVPPEHVESLRQQMSGLYDATMKDPEGMQAVVDARMQKIQTNN
jgi:hypothetical protein